MTLDSQLYQALRDYKGYRDDVATRHRRRLAGLIGVFLEHHARCLAPFDFDAITVVPSRSGRTGVHPLIEVLRTIEELPPVEELLQPGRGAIARSFAAPDAFLCSRDLDGQRILLVDNTYTTGAHMQSAAHALRGAGASLRLLAIGRMIHEDWEPSRPLVEWTRSHNWAPNRCVRCT